MNKKSIHIEIGHKSIIFAIAFILALKFLSEISGILIALFISVLISTAVYPLVNALKKIGIPRALSAASILVLILLSIFATFASIIPPVIEQTTSLIQNLPNIIDQLGVYNIDSSVVTSEFGKLSGNLLRFALDTFSVTVLLTTIIVISFYLIMERANLDKHLRVLFGEKADKIKDIIIEVEVKLGHWVRAMLFLMVIIGISTYLGLYLIGIEYALPLAILAGVLEIVPNIGPTVAAIPAAIVGFAMSPLHGMLTIGLSILIQQLENGLIVPNVMSKTTDLHPVITIIALLIGFELGGALLAILSLPLVLTFKIIFTHYYRHFRS